jgi:large subunit ribosomal protein L9
MKVILTEEVIGLGEPGKVVEVAAGYARNFLVPRKLAVYADTGRLRELEHHTRRLERKRQHLQEAAQTAAARLSGQTVTIDGRAGKEGKLYGSVTSADIATALLAQHGVTIDRRKIHLREPIRTLGTHSVEIHLLGDTRATVPVLVIDREHPQVEPEAVPAPAEEAPVVEATVEATDEA